MDLINSTNKAKRLLALNLVFNLLCRSSIKKLQEKRIKLIRLISVTIYNEQLRYCHLFNVYLWLSHCNCCCCDFLLSCSLTVQLSNLQIISLSTDYCQQVETKIKFINQFRGKILTPFWVSFMAMDCYQFCYQSQKKMLIATQLTRYQLLIVKRLSSVKLV